ncbi:hypothetical protein DH2020_028195 [Rehmannia glutinosa]|uniref:AB hydrolase-1 domain-containing protein n=1 Tax=Rehmannia glutinosa TaxID=99300 RepID=A0ABR0VVP6_REHGL
MSEVNESAAWRGEFTGLLDEDVGKANGYSYSSPAVDGGASAAAEVGDWRFQVAEFAKGAAEMSVEFGKGVRDVMKQSILRDDSVVMRKFKGPCLKILGKLSFLNEYLPEDRDPVRAWTVIACVWVFLLAVLIVNITQTTTPLVKKMKVHPTSASLMLLPDGRRLAYQEQGVPADQARYSMIIPHSFLSSRIAGIPGLKGALLQEFGVRLVTYDLPGFGESDPHPDRDLESSALDMLHLSYAVNVTDKFWVVGYSDGSKHAWAALHYIPDRLAGAVMLAPMVNPYEQRLIKEERRRIWGTWTDRALVEGRMFKTSGRETSKNRFDRQMQNCLLRKLSYRFQIGVSALQNSMYRTNERGAEDTVVPPSMSDFVHRVVPDVMLHKLPYEGHFSYFYFCDECHRQIFTVVFGNPQGPLAPKEDPIPIEVDDEEKTEVIFSDTTTDKDNVSTIDD